MKHGMFNLNKISIKQHKNVVQMETDQLYNFIDIQNQNITLV